MIYCCLAISQLSVRDNRYWIPIPSKVNSHELQLHNDNGSTESAQSLNFRSYTTDTQNLLVEITTGVVIRLSDIMSHEASKGFAHDAEQDTHI